MKKRTIRNWILRYFDLYDYAQVGNRIKDAKDVERDALHELIKDLVDGSNQWTYGGYTDDQIREKLRDFIKEVTRDMIETELEKGLQDRVYNERFIDEIVARLRDKQLNQGS
jgi:hypothetical protein